MTTLTAFETLILLVETRCPECDYATPRDTTSENYARGQRDWEELGIGEWYTPLPRVIPASIARYGLRCGQCGYEPILLQLEPVP